MVIYRTRPIVSDEQLNELFVSAWGNFTPTTFDHVRERSLTYICAYDEDKLIGFVNVAWDGGIHAFILDTTVHESYQRQGIGGVLVERASSIAETAGITWLHADFEPHLVDFYRACGFRHTEAGLRNLRE